MEQIRILGVKIDNVSMDEAVEQAKKWLDGEQTRMVATPNPEIAYRAYRDPEFCRVLNSADLTLPDGIGIVYGAKILGTPLKERVPGFDFSCRVLTYLAECGKSVFFLGGKPGVAERAAAESERKFPGLRVVGTHDGYFREDAPVIEEINRSGADFLMVCLGFPKQETWIAQHRGELCAKLCIGAGGSVDVLAGEVKRAPAFFCKTGLEWFYRLITQPWRIGRMMTLPRFLLTVIAKKGKNK